MEQILGSLKNSTTEVEPVKVLPTLHEYTPTIDEITAIPATALKENRLTDDILNGTTWEGKRSLYCLFLPNVI